MIWALLIILFAVFGILGFFKGGLRMIVNFVGIALGLVLMLPLAPSVAPLAMKLGVEHPAGIAFVAALLVFLGFDLLFFILAFVAHHFWVARLRNRMNESQLSKWHRLNRGLGTLVGAITATTYVCAISLAIYVFGNFTTPFKNEAQDPSWLSRLNNARAALDSSGLTPLVSKFDKTEDATYEAIETMGFIYNNPQLSERLSLYPSYLEYVSGRSTFEFNGIDINAWWKKKGSLDEILSSAGFAGALAFTVLSSGQVDVADLREYLETGYSPKFEDEKILGFWKTDPSEVMRLLKRENPDMSVDELVAAKELAITVLDGIHLTADAKGSLEVFTIETDTMKRYQERKSQKKGSDPTTLLDQAVEHTFDRAFEDRYGVSMSQGQSNATAGARGADAARQAREAREALEAEKKFQFDGSGSWKQGSGTSMTGTPYSVTVGNQNVDAEVIGGRLFLYPSGGPTLIMNKIVH